MINLTYRGQNSSMKLVNCGEVCLRNISIRSADNDHSIFVFLNVASKINNRTQQL